MNRTTNITTVFVCVIQPILEQVLAVVMAKSAIVNVMQTDTTGDSRLSKRPFSLVKGKIIIFAKDNPPKDT